MSGNQDNAVLACDEAITLAETEKFAGTAQTPSHFQLKTRAKYRGMALSNRGVLRAIIGQEDLARQDSADALALTPQISAVKANLTKLDELAE